MTKVKRYSNPRQKRQVRGRAKIGGTAQKPRLSVFRSNCYIYAQLIDDEQGRTLAAASDRKLADINRADRAGKVGEELAAQAKKAGIETIVFDRSGYRYHGRVKALAEGARAGGLQF